jgi:hypothetical protein
MAGVNLSIVAMRDRMGKDDVIISVATVWDSSNRRLTSTRSLLVSHPVAMGGFRLSLLCHHSSDGLVAVSHLPIATMGYDPRL